MFKFLKVTDRQWVGLLISVIISVLIWWKMVFIFHKGKDKDPNKINISKYQWCGLGVSILIGTLGWFRTVNIVDR